MKVYRSKIDLWLLIFITAIILVAIISTVIGAINEHNILALVLSLISLIIPSLLIIDVYRNTYYTIDDSSRTLVVKSGILVNSIYNIDNITQIKKSNTWLSSPALSTDRLEIRLGKFSRVVISPNDKELFIKHLLKLNPNIDVKI